jgi:8-oxo-dGTP pyrophosphatase MutT (NUDIX family)
MAWPLDPMTRLPADQLPIWHRFCVRLVVTDVDGAVLLLATRDATYPELGTWWELPGGGVEPGERLVDTAIRELREETGLRVTPEQVDVPLWSRVATFRQHGTRHVQAEEVMRVRLMQRQPELDPSMREENEVEDYFGHRWWRPEDIIRSEQRTYPGRLAEFLPHVLQGRVVREDFENFS